MKPLLISLVGSLLLVPAVRADIRGIYIEARTCDVYTGPCFANADTALGGKHAVLAWKIESGQLGGTSLDGLGVVAVVATRETLGLKQTLPGKAVLIVDVKADANQRQALIDFARSQTGGLLDQIIDIKVAPVNVEVCECPGNSCCRMRAGDARIETKCLDAHYDKACGNESAYYPPLAANVNAKPALAVEHAYTGRAFNETWRDTARRGAYVGTFLVR
jgi:hypothetical protein